jgi:hypothetical protein
MSSHVASRALGPRLARSFYPFLFHDPGGLQSRAGAPACLISKRGARHSPLLTCGCQSAFACRGRLVVFLVVWCIDYVEFTFWSWTWMYASLLPPRFTTDMRFIGFQALELLEGHSLFTAFSINQPSKTTASRCDIHTLPPLGA